MANHDILHISLFGNLTIFTPNSEPVEIPPSRAGALLALLAIGSSNLRPVPREEIVDLLWPEDDADAARHKLRQTLYHVRQLIATMNLDPDRILIATRSSIQLSPDRVSIDAAAFEAELRAAGQSSNPTIRSGHLSAAVELYKGELLPGFYQDRFIAEKTRLEEAYQGALKSLALAYEETEQYDRGIETARELLALNPLNEEAHFALMRLYAATGQPSLVLRQYQNLERTLKDELGEAPSRSAQRLMESLRETAMARSTERGVGSSPSLVRSVDTDEIASTDPTPRAGSVAEVCNDPARPLAPEEPHALWKNRRRWAIAAFSPVALCLMILIFVSGHRQHTSTKGAHPTAPPAQKPHPRATVLARYVLAPDERGSEPTAIATDHAGNTLVAGFVETTHSDADFITLKYDLKGRLLWRRRYDGTGNDVDRLRCIAFDGTGNVFVSGESDNGKGNGSTRLSGLDVVTIMYSAEGHELWQDRYDDIDKGDDRPVKMVVDSTGNAYVLCSCRRLRNGKDAGCDFVLLKYSASGKRLWVQRFDGEAHSDDVPTSMALLYKDSGVCVCGYSRAVYKTGPEYDYMTIKYSADGKQIWQQRYGAGNQADDYARDVTADQDGNVYVVGEGHGLPGTPDESRIGCIMVKYSSSGDFLWARGTDTETHRLQRVTAATFWSDGYVAVAGPAVNDDGSPVYRVVMRNCDGGTERVCDDYAAPHPMYRAPCALLARQDDVTHDALWMVGSRTAGSDMGLEFRVDRLSYHGAFQWQDGFSPANGMNSARAAALNYGDTVVVAGLCTDRSGKGGITLVKYRY